MKINKAVFSLLTLLSSCSNETKGSTLPINNDSQYSSSSTSDSIISSKQDLKQYDFNNLDYSNDGYIKNSYKNKYSFKVNGNEDYKIVKDSTLYDESIDVSKFNKYDLSIPNNITNEDLDKKYTIMLVIHPGGWISGSKDELKFGNYSITNVLSGNYSSTDSYASILKSNIKERYITINMNYTLMVQETGHKELSIYRMLDEIDQCLNHAVDKLVEIGFKKENLSLVLAGGSAGSYLAMLYGYSRGKEAVIKPKAIVNLVGPVSFNYKAWRQFKDEEKRKNGGDLSPQNINYEETEELEYTDVDYSYVTKFNQYQTMRFTNGMAGSIYSDEQIKSTTADYENVDENNSISKILLGEVEKSLSPIDFIKNNPIPIFSIYGGKDQYIGINQYATLKLVLDENNVKNDSYLEKTFTHYLGTDSNIIFSLSIYQKMLTKLQNFLIELGL